MTLLNTNQLFITSKGLSAWPHISRLHTSLVHVSHVGSEESGSHVSFTFSACCCVSVFFSDYLTFGTHQILSFFLLLFWFSVSSDLFLLMIQQSANSASRVLTRLCRLRSLYSAVMRQKATTCHFSNSLTTNAQPGTRHTHTYCVLLFSHDG